MTLTTHVWLATTTLVLLRAGAHAQEVRLGSLYGSVDYLLWSVKAAPLSVPLVSTGPESVFNGFLLNSSARILYGASRASAVGGRDQQDFSPFNGGRLTLGYAIDPARGLGVEASGFGLQSRQTTFVAGGDGSAANGIRVPVYNAVPYFINVPIDAIPSENGLPVALPNRIGGQVKVTNRLSLWGLDVAGTRDLLRGPNWSVTGLAGLRYLDLAEDFTLRDYFYGTRAPFAGQSGTVQDHFGTTNRFIGAMLGVRTQASWGRLSAAAQVRLALGATVEALSVAGGFQAVNYAPSSGAQGIFAQPNNSGNRSSGAFAVQPEFKIKLGYDLSPNLRLTVGYDFLYLSNVIRPTDQIDRNIPKGNVFGQGGTVTTTGYPARLFRTTDFYAQGLNTGLSFRF